MTRRLEDALGKHVRKRNLPALFDMATTWYEGWYFDLRLVEEIARIERYGGQLSLVTLQLRDDLGGPLLPKRQQFNAVLAEIVSKHLRRMDIPAVLAANEMAICLPQIDTLGAHIVADRIAGYLSDYRVEIGVAGCPEDGFSSEALFSRAAESAIIGSRSGVSDGRLV